MGSNQIKFGFGIIIVYLITKLLTMNSTKLKSDAYDTLAQIEYLQKKLQDLNQQIAEALKNENDNIEVID